MVTGYSYSTYERWNFFVPLFTTAVTGVLIIIAVFISFPCTWPKRWGRARYYNLLYHMNKVIFRDSLKKKDTKPLPVFKLYDVEISPNILNTFLPFLLPMTAFYHLLGDIRKHLLVILALIASYRILK